MTTSKKTIRRTAFAFAVLGLLLPVTVSPSQGIEGNEACANGSCCRELMSTCLGSDGSTTMNYYSDSDGVCNQVKA